MSPESANVNCIEAVWRHTNGGQWSRLYTACGGMDSGTTKPQHIGMELY